MGAPMEGDETGFDVNASILKHIAMIKPWFPKRAIICAGEYPIKILLRGSFATRTDEDMVLLVEKSRKDIARWSETGLKEENVLGLDAEVDTHFWFNVLSHLAKNDAFMVRLKNKSVDKMREALIMSSTWDGLGSAMLPTLISKLRAWNVESVAFAVLPSKAQPSDARLNAFSSLGMCASKEFTPLVLVERDCLEDYVGVDRKGSIIKGNSVLDYVLELLLEKETFIQEISELSRPFNVRMFTVLAATGASLKIYGSLENMLNTVLVKPLSGFDLSSASLSYVVVRVPSKFKDKFSKGRIELAVADWLRKKAKLKSVYASEPVYAEDSSDRVDVAMLVGGFDVTKVFASMEKEVSALKKEAVDRGLLKEENWQEIVKGLIKD